MDFRQQLHECNTGNHVGLIEIYRTEDLVNDESEVVRWCNICGAIVVDTEYDGRVKPGGVLKMMGPKIVDHVQLYYDS